MAVSRGPHVKDIFIQKETPMNNFAISTYPKNGFHYEKNQTKTKHKSTKKNAAPPRPTFADYKPKILQVDSIVNVPMSRNTPTPLVPKQPEHSVTSKPLIIGDKDTPIVIEPIDDEEYAEIIDDSVSDVTTQNVHSEDRSTTNPLFDNGGNSSLGHVGESHRYRTSSRDTRASHSVIRETISEEINGVSVPEPDYEEDEVIMEFEVEVDLDLDGGINSRPKSVFKDFEGEDFSKYLNDEYEENTHRQTTQSRFVNRTEGKRYKKRDSSTMFGGTNKQIKPKAGSVRCYSVEDTKLAIGMDGNARQSSVRNGIDYGSTYESFLNSRHGNVTENGFSDTRGLEIGDTSKLNDHKKQPLWKKLTWKLKRQVVMIH